MVSVAGDLVWSTLALSHPDAPVYVIEPTAMPERATPFVPALMATVCGPGLALPCTPAKVAELAARTMLGGPGGGPVGPPPQPARASPSPPAIAYQRRVRAIAASKRFLELVPQTPSARADTARSRGARRSGGRSPRPAIRWRPRSPSIENRVGGSTKVAIWRAAANGAAVSGRSLFGGAGDRSLLADPPAVGDLGRRGDRE